MTEPADLRVVAPGPGEQSPATDRGAWIAAGVSLSGSASERSWEFAYWLAAGHAAWGAEAMSEAAKRTGAPPGKISNYLATAKAYPPIRRRIALTFSHHMEAARLPDTEREQLLDRAEAGGWSRAETRAAAREASLEVKNANLRRKVAELERALAAAKADPRDVAKQARSRVDAERRVIRDAGGRAADTVEELLESGVLDGLHGNARRGLARDIRRSANAIVQSVNRDLERMETAAARIEGSPA